ncbi:MAG: hypothetical protein QXY37_01345 [Metallosphaera sp.]
MDTNISWTIWLTEGASNIVQIAQRAVKGGHRQIDNKLLVTKPGYITLNDVNVLASTTAEEGHRDIVDDMINMGANDDNRIAKHAAAGGHKDIVDDMIQRGATDFRKIAHYAAMEGHIDIVFDMERRMELDSLSLIDR